MALKRLREFLLKNRFKLYAIVLCELFVLAQVSHVLTFSQISSIAQHMGGRLLFPSDAPYIVRDTGSGYQYLSSPALTPVTPPGNLTGATTTLNGAINNSVTSLTLTSSTGFGAVWGTNAVPFEIQIDSENILCTALAANVCTGSRGVDGTSAASHSNGATITLLVWQQINFTTGVTATTNGGQIYIHDPGLSSDSVHILKMPCPTVPFTATANMMINAQLNNATVGQSHANMGMILRNPSGPLVTWNSGTDSTNGMAFELAMDHWTNNTTFSANAFRWPWRTTGGQVTFRIKYDGTNRLMSYGLDPLNPEQLTSETWTTFTTPTEIGVYIDNIQPVGTLVPAGMTLVGWVITTP